MAATSRNASSAPTPEASFAAMTPGADWWGPLAQTFLQAQRTQLDAIIAWQKALADMNQELWDEWVCRWAGGAPLDA